MSDTTESRFEVGNDRVGAWYFTSTFADAKREAEILSARLHETCTIYDRMARRGSGRLWKVYYNDCWLFSRRK